MTETPLSALRLPTEEEKLREYRLYLIVRSDLPMSRHEIAGYAAQGCWKAVSKAYSNAPERFEAYHAAAQPKIALRVRSRLQLERAIQESAALPGAVIRRADGEPAVLVIGPALGHERSPFVQKLQLLGGEGIAEPAGPPPIDHNIPQMIILIRTDAQIPFGKLGAQAGHGAIRSIRGLLQQADPLITQWDLAGAPIIVRDIPDKAAMESFYASCQAAGLASAFIIDAGRTVFTEPTETILGIAPCYVADLPAPIRALVTGPVGG